MNKSSNFYNKYIKRFLGIVLSLIGIIILSPLLIVIWCLVKIEEPNNPAIFKQKRVGYKGKIFLLYKFRSMKSSAPKYLATEEIEPDNNYSSKLGKFIRRTSIDEFPQLFNILNGDMSLVGPRPVIPQEKELNKLRKENGVFEVRPGITGYAQINGRDNVTVEKKVELDSYYGKNISFLLDLKLLLLTIPNVLFQIGNKDNRHEEAELKDKSMKLQK